MDARQIVAAALTTIEGYTPSPEIQEDHLSFYEGDRFVETMRYARGYPEQLPLLSDLLPAIQTPVRIIAGSNDQVAHRPIQSSSMPGHRTVGSTSSAARATSAGKRNRTSARRSSRTGGTRVTRPGDQGSHGQLADRDLVTGPPVRSSWEGLTNLARAAAPAVPGQSGWGAPRKGPGPPPCAHGAGTASCPESGEAAHWPAL